jgi:hypothetical protein
VVVAALPAARPGYFHSPACGRVDATAATLIEEFIPYNLAEAVARQESRLALLPEVARTAATLAKAGFAPLGAHDWRSRGADVVLVDFGQDLGDARTQSGSEAGILSEVLDNLSRSGVELSASELRSLGDAYETILQS